MSEEKIRESYEKCPCCKSDIKKGARKCPHCLTDISSMIPQHGGNCPVCKEDIDPHALRCKHCKSWVTSGAIPVAGGVQPAGIMARSRHWPTGMESWPLELFEGIGGSSRPSMGEMEEYRICHNWIDMSTYNPRTKKALEKETCTDAQGNNPHTRAIGWVIIGEVEYY